MENGFMEKKCFAIEKKICFLLLLSFISLICVCGKGSGKPDVAITQADLLLGSWLNADHPQKPMLTFNNNQTYFLKFMRSDQQYNGNYHTSGDMIHVLDFYCGTVIPGLYRFSVKGNELSFVVVDDAKCDRSKFFSQTWKRVK
jgi:hypothetical protein